MSMLCGGSGEWTVAVSKRKPKGKKEPSPSKDIDTSNPIDLNTDVAVVTSAQVPQVCPCTTSCKFLW